jgi:hypothetical protein
MIEPPNSVLLLVGRDEFTPPRTFGGSELVATTHDCIAVGVQSVDDGPTLASLAAHRSEHELMPLGDFIVESEGQVSIRDVYNREYDSMGVEPGRVRVAVFGDDDAEPSQVEFVVQPS